MLRADSLMALKTHRIPKTVQPASNCAGCGIDAPQEDGLVIFYKLCISGRIGAKQLVWLPHIAGLVDRNDEKIFRIGRRSGSRNQAVRIIVIKSLVSATKCQRCGAGCWTADIFR